MDKEKIFEQHKLGLYAKYLKRYLDFFISLFSLIVLSPFLLFFTIVGLIKFGGNPFFIQERSGKNGKTFNLIKFRTMTNKRDVDGNLLSDKERLTVYGNFLRTNSIDELLEVINILKGDMSFIGPRPLLKKYLSLYDDYEMHRHDVRPGLTGYAQVNGRNNTTWEERFQFDIEYVQNITFIQDTKIFFKTIIKVLKKEDITSNSSVTMEEFKGTFYKKSGD